MNSFYAIQPSPQLTPFVKQYWCVSLDMANVRQRLIPFCCIGLTFHRLRSPSLLNNLSLHDSYISGLTTRYTELRFEGNIDFITIVFEPAGAMQFFNLPICEISNTHISIDDLEDKSYIDLKNILTDTSDISECVKIIETFLIKKLNNFDECRYNRLSNSINFICNNIYDISLLAKTACLGYKQFQRVFFDNIGINPKEYIRINRFQKTSHALQYEPSSTLDSLADRYNYYDKSHLIKDFREFSGYTPKEYVNRCDPYSSYHALFRSAFLDSD